MWSPVEGSREAMRRRPDQRGSSDVAQSEADLKSDLSVP
jgi:hypothetical protein